MALGGATAANRGPHSRPVPRRQFRIRQAQDGSQWITSRELEENIFGNRKVPDADVLRRTFGASVTPELIESVIRMADNGYMRDLTDLTKETINFDPHLATVIGKRFRALASIAPKVTPAAGPGVDTEKAALYADLIRQQLAMIPRLRQHVIQLSWAHCNGRAALEKVWQESPDPQAQAKYWIRELNWIHPRRLSFGPLRELRVRDDLWNGGNFEARGLDIESIPHKFLAYKPQLFDEYPEREGFGPRALYYSFFKRFGWRERMVLVEVYGKPWRIVTLDPAFQSQDPDVLDRLEERADELGANASAAFPAGVKLGLENPDPKSPEAHRMVSQDCDDQISKLVLGNTRTTDAKADGLGGQQALIHQDGEVLVISADGWGTSECVTDGISRDFVALNFGAEQTVNAPTIELPFEIPPDATAEIERVNKALDIGVPLRLEEVYQRSGFARPEEGDEVVTREAPAAMPGMGMGGAQPGQVSTIAPTDGGDATLPLARATARSLRLSRLSRTGFSPR